MSSFGFNSYTSSECNAPILKLSVKKQTIKLTPNVVSMKIAPAVIKFKMKVICNG